MSIAYRLTVLGERGMYTHGDLAASPELARLAPGYLQRRASTRLGVEQVDLGAALGDEERPEVLQRVLVEAEDHPGQWAIGA